jgi:hypothetical protein
MIEESRGSSQLAIMADTLPVRARVCLALLAASIALDHLRTSAEFSFARDALTLAQMWQEGKPVSPDELGEPIEGEESRIAFAMMRPDERSE